MLPRLQAQLHEVRLDLHHRWLHRQERAALRRLGEEIAGRVESGGSEELDRLAVEIGGVKRQLELLAAESATSLAADHTDLGRVAPWVRPVVVARGVCTRMILWHRAGAARRRLRPRYEAFGELAVRGGLAAPRRDVVSARAGRERLLAERERRLAPFAGTAHPAWTRQAATETVGLTRAVLNQVRSTLLPKTPALAGMVVGWWIASTYTDSHVRSVLRSIGFGSGGTHVVSGSTFKAMSFWLPLLAAAVCAYLGERIVGYYRKRASPEAGTPDGEAA
jgi:hypothetical protein